MRLDVNVKSSAAPTSVRGAEQGAYNPWLYDQNAHEHQQMLATGHVDTEASSRALANLRDAEDISIASAEALDDQGEGIERMQNTVDDVNHQLVHADRLVKGIGSWKHTISNTFTSVDAGRERGTRGARRGDDGYVPDDAGDYARDESADGRRYDGGADDSGAGAQQRQQWSRTERTSDAYAGASPAAAASSPAPSCAPVRKLHEWGGGSSPGSREQPARRAAAARPPPPLHVRQAAKRSGVPKQWGKPAAQPGDMGLSAHASAEQRAAWQKQQREADEMNAILGNLNEMNVAMATTTECQTAQLEHVAAGVDESSGRLDALNTRIGKIVD
jgi:hypothetical protein